MAETSPTLSLPYLQPAQAQKHVTHNEALRMLDAVTQLAVLNAALTEPPALPEAGDRYIVAAGATGEWAGQDHAIALWVDSTWQFFAPRTGWRADVTGSGDTLRFDGVAWVSPAVPPLQNLPLLGVATTADATSRLAVSSDATLLTHAGSDHQVKINKAAAGDTASLLYQTGFSGRAEMGLAGSDGFSIKVSPDGSTWENAIHVDAASYRVGFGTDAPNYPLHVHRPGSAGAALQLTNGESGSGATDGFWFGFSNKAYFWNFENLDTQFATNNTARMTLKADGKVGIGTVSPASLLDVNGAVRCGRYTTAARPSATTSGAGAMVFDTTLAKPVWSDGTVWRDAAGVAV